MSDTRSQRFGAFVAELEKLCKKYNVSVRSTGGVTVGSDGDRLVTIRYSRDWTSGDLNAEMKWESASGNLDEALSRIYTELKSRTKDSQSQKGLQQGLALCERLIERSSVGNPVVDFLKLLKPEISELMGVSNAWGQAKRALLERMEEAAEKRLG